MNMNREEVTTALAVHYSVKFNGIVWSMYDPGARSYTIHGNSLPAAPELADQYPNGWSLMDVLSPAKARSVADTFQKKAVHDYGAMYKLIRRIAESSYDTQAADLIDAARAVYKDIKET